MTTVKIARRLLPVAIGAALLCQGHQASAMSLMQAYEAALKNDPTYRAAYYSGEAGKQSLALGRSALLPSVNGSYSGSQNRNTITYLGREIPQDYLSRTATVQVRQGVINLEGIARYKQGKAQSAYAEYQFASQSQEVILRMAGAYFEVLFKQEQLALAKIEREVYVEQKKVNELLYKKGEGTVTDVLETQSRLDLAEASLLEAEDNLTSSRDTLAAIVGAEPGELDHLRPGFRIDARDYKSFDAWKNIAMEQNPDIKAQTQGVEVANQEVNKQRSAHFPRLDVVATYGKTASETVSTVGQDQVVRSIGFQMNIPIYAGGAVSASTRQAAANKEKAREDLEAQTDKVLVELRRNYNQVISSAPKIDALIKAVDSAKLLITATEQSIKGGVRINLDLLNAQRQLYTAQRDLAQARYGYMLASLRLRAFAGTLSADDVKMLAAYFE
ncbi:TolC family outer membrane protein [Pseudoduganella sp. UC29_106]|uniref:TolC family outer membrane protein n=1 Tax=Pseudoduganella sp. UC29_106 TaxID=3374553 RepID=UPI00375668F0